MNPWSGLRALPREIWILFVSMLINRMGTMVLPFLAIYVTEHLHLSASQAGLILAIYGIGAMLTAPLSGYLCDHYGSHSVMKASLFTSAVALLCFPFARGFSQVVYATLFLAFTTETFRPACLAYASVVVPPEQRKAAFAVIRLSINLGMSVGPAVGGFLAILSYNYLFLIDGITSLLAGIVLTVASLNRGRSTSPRTENVTAEKSILTAGAWRDRRLIYYVLALIPVLLTFFQHMSAMPLFMVHDLHLSEAVYGLMFTINTILIIIVEVPLNLATSHWSFRRSLWLGSLLFGVGFGGLAFAHGVWTVAVTVVIWTFGEMILFPASSAYVASLAPAERQGQYMGVYVFAFSIAFTIGPWMGAYLFDRIGAQLLWILMFGFALVSTLLMLRIDERTNIVSAT